MTIVGAIVEIRILDAQVTFERRALRRPLVLSSGTIRELTEAQVAVRVEAGGHEAVGRGSIYLSVLWAWPAMGHRHAAADAALRRVCERIATRLPSLCGHGRSHPLEAGLALHAAVCHGTGSPPPPWSRVRRRRPWRWPCA
jgi:hypothetical protein